MNGIIDLPADDLWPIIFQNLSINDLFMFRLVNKQFKKFISSANLINKLIIGQPDYSDISSTDLYWYYNNTSIKDEEIISLKCYSLIKSRSIFNLDKNLKYLKICDQQFELKELSNLIHLESIEFGRSCNYDQQIIHSNNLKVIVCNSSKLSIKLNTSKLEKIQFDNINKIELNGNPESIKHIVTKNYYNKLEIFKNLEIMELRNMIDTNQFVNENLLIIFKYLKKLKINFDDFPDDLDERIKNSLIKILNDKIKLKREIDIYLEGVKIENIDKFNEFAAIKFSYCEFRSGNYHLLDLNLPFITVLNYFVLEIWIKNNMKNNLPLSFFDKFFNINKVNVRGGVNDINGLIWFLNNLKYLTSLDISHNSLLDELLFNNLPISIRILSVSHINIDYNFILKLPKLVEFTTLSEIDLFDLAFTSFLNLKYLKSFQFGYRKVGNISIKKEGNGYILNFIEEEELDYNQLVEKCNSIRSK